MRRSCFPIFWWCRMRSASKWRFEAGEGPQLDADHGSDGIRAAAIRASITMCWRRSMKPCGVSKQQLHADDGTARLLRRAVDGRDLHDRRPRHARPGAGAAVCLSRCRTAFAALIDVLVEARPAIWCGSSRPAPMRCRFSIPGPACCRRSSSSAGASSRRKRIVDRCVRASAGREDHRLSARRRRECCRVMSKRPASMPSASTG